MWPFSICILSNPSLGQDSEAFVKSSMDTDCNPEKTVATISGSSMCSVVTGKGILYKQSAAWFWTPGQYSMSYEKHSNRADHLATLIPAWPIRFVASKVVNALWSVRKVKWWPHKYGRHFSTANTQAKAYFSTVEYFLSAALSIREAKAKCVLHHLHGVVSALPQDHSPKHQWTRS